MLTHSGSGSSAAAVGGEGRAPPAPPLLLLGRLPDPRCDAKADREERDRVDDEGDEGDEDAVGDVGSSSLLCLSLCWACSMAADRLAALVGLIGERECGMACNAAACADDIGACVGDVGAAAAAAAAARLRRRARFAILHILTGIPALSAMRSSAAARLARRHCLRLIPARFAAAVSSDLISALDASAARSAATRALASLWSW